MGGELGCQPSGELKGLIEHVELDPKWENGHGQTQVTIRVGE